MISSTQASSLTSSSSSCSVKLSTLVKKINLNVPNRKNASIIFDFYKYMEEKEELLMLVGRKFNLELNLSSL